MADASTEAKQPPGEGNTELHPDGSLPPESSHDGATVETKEQAPSGPSSGGTTDAKTWKDSGLETPYHTRDTTYIISKESSVSLMGESGSKEPTFVSVDSKSHLAARIGALPQNSPTADQPLIDTEGNVRHMTPRNVNLGQFYPEIDMPSRKKNDQLALKSSEDNFQEAPEEQINEPENPQEGETEQVAGAGQTDSAEVFSTQVDEEVLEAAKRRQETMFDPPWMLREQRLPTMSEVVLGRADEHFQKGNEHARQKEYEKAIQCYNKAVNLQPKDISYYVSRGEAFLHICDFQSAILNYKRACVLDPENEEFYNRLAFIYFFQGQCLFDQKLFPEALEAFSRATEMRPDVIGYHTRSIACLAALQRHGECLALVNKRLELEQENADLYVMRARLHHLFRNTTLCYYDIKDALSLESSHREAVALMKHLETKATQLKQQATHLNLMGRHRDALQKISVAIETNPSVADYHILRGALHRRLGDFNAAIDDYLLALDKTDHDEDSAIYQESQRQLLLTYNDFAVECFSKNYFEEAIILLNKAIKGEKREKGLYINRGDCFFKEGNLQFAMADYHQALELDGVDPAIRSRIAVIHNEYGIQEFQDKNYAEAESRFTLGIQHSPHSGQYYISCCRARQMMENLSSARQDILMALLLDPGNPELMPILTRLFPGKSIKDILQSKATNQARKALEHIIAANAPAPLKPITESSDDGDEEQDEHRKSAILVPEATPAAEALWQQDRCFPDLKSCMEEKSFHIRVISEKNKVNQEVRGILREKHSLLPSVSKLRPLPESVPYERRGGQGIKKKSVDVNKPAVQTGWRNFGLGITVPDMVD